MPQVRVKCYTRSSKAFETTAMVHRLRYILPVVVLLAFAGWVYSDDIPKPDLGTAIQSLQSTLSQIQTQIKDLQASVKDLARQAKEAKAKQAPAKNEPKAETGPPAKVAEAAPADQATT